LEWVTRWRTDLQLPEPDRLIITHYNLPPEGQGQEAKAVETEYRRVRRCATT
jgi:hypothetical protein